MVAELPCSRHFFKVMINDFHTKLSIPPRFSEKLNGEEMERAVLTSCRVSWDVEVVKCGSLFQFKNGWKEYVQNHDLNLGDFVVFEHKGNMRFDVLVFDSSACEKRLSVSDKSGNKRVRTSGQADIIEFDYSQKRSMAQRQENNSHDHVRQFIEADSGTEAEANAGTEAEAEASERPYFSRTITSANCRSRFPYLNIPTKFWRSNDILTEERTVDLRDPLKRIWQVKLRLQRGGQRLSLGSGWFQFCQRNKVKIGDTCVFELNPTSPQSPYPLLDVSTFSPHN